MHYQIDLLGCTTFIPFMNNSPLHFIRVCFTLLTFALLLQTYAQAPDSNSVAGYSTGSLNLETGGYGAPEWLVESTQADDWADSNTLRLVASKPYAERPPHPITPAQPVGRQPAGALTGKVIYAMAGHGWTYESEKMTYYTQRGLGHGVVEDFGNADQMHIFAHLLFNSGATVVPLRPIDHQPNERIVDNSASQCQLFGEWAEGGSSQYFGSKYDSVRYAVTTASMTETAVARYQPHIPEDGYYPVYAWARDGIDRVQQTYRIAHAGGTNEVLVNHRLTGKSWVWLGTYYFNTGSMGFVEVTNQVVDPYEADGKHVAVADAIRFGNGFGDVPRPGGISTFTREDEGDSYWIERSLGNGSDRRIFGGSADGNATVASPPRASAYINRENEGGFFDRLLVSFHSNAATGKARGAVALFNASERQRPTYQENLAELIGSDINREIQREDPLANLNWADRQRHTYNGINFGELRKDYLQNEMSATIVETAFHDNEEDAEFLLDPSSRLKMAQATLRGTLTWFSRNRNLAGATELMPSAPPALVAIPVKDKIQIQWKLGAVDNLSGSPANTFRIYRSKDGYSFDGGLQVSGTEAIVDPLTSSGVTFIRVSASNASGESLPSQTIAVGLISEKPSPPNPKIIVVSGAIPADKSLNMTQIMGGSPNVAYSEADATFRVRLIQARQKPLGAEEAFALSSLGNSFAGANAEALQQDMLKLSPSQTVIYDAGFQNPQRPLLERQTQVRLRTLVANGGKLFINGAAIAANATAQDWDNYSRQVFGVSHKNSLGAANSLSSLDSRFYDAKSPLYLKQSAAGGNLMHYPFAAEVLTPTPSLSLPLLSYDGTTPGTAAVITKPSGSKGEVIYFGFEFDRIASREAQEHIMASILKQL